jgi:hypothetical protein
MPKKISVLMISNSYPNPLNLNAGIFIHNLVKALVKHNCEIKVFCPIPLSFYGNTMNTKAFQRL